MKWSKLQESLQHVFNLDGMRNTILVDDEVLTIKVSWKQVSPDTGMQWEALVETLSVYGGFYKNFTSHRIDIDKVKYGPVLLNVFVNYFWLHVTKCLLHLGRKTWSAIYGIVELSINSYTSGLSKDWPLLFYILIFTLVERTYKYLARIK